jgi:hypothetical protein
VVEDYRPEVVSFHFGLPPPDLLDRVKRTGAKILSSALPRSPRPAGWRRGVDAVIAMGAEAGGHRGSFLTDEMSAQIGTFALVPQIVDAISVPVIAAGGIADRRGVVAAFALGAAAVQVGTAYLLHARSQDLARLSRGADSARPADGGHQPVYRPAGARHRQSPDGGSRPAVGTGAGLPDRRHGAGAAAQRRGSRGPRRLQPAVGRAILPARSADARGNIDQSAHGRGILKVSVNVAWNPLRAN